MLFRLSGSLLRYRNALRVRYWAASCSGRRHLWERNTVRRHEPNPTPILLVKIEGSLQELEETEYWLELLGEAGFFPKDGLAAVRKETSELKGIFVSIVINTKDKSKLLKRLFLFIFYLFAFILSKFLPPFAFIFSRNLSFIFKKSACKRRAISLEYRHYFI